MTIPKNARGKLSVCYSEEIAYSIWIDYVYLLKALAVVQHLPFYCLTILSEDFKASIHFIPGSYSLSGSGNLPLLFGYVV